MTFIDEAYHEFITLGGRACKNLVTLVYWKGSHMLRIRDARQVSVKECIEWSKVLTGST